MLSKKITVLSVVSGQCHPTSSRNKQASWLYFDHPTSWQARQPELWPNHENENCRESVGDNGYERHQVVFGVSRKDVLPAKWRIRCWFPTLVGLEAALSFGYKQQDPQGGGLDLLDRSLPSYPCVLYCQEDSLFRRFLALRRMYTFSI